jgi:hypothetical protein
MTDGRRLALIRKLDDLTDADLDRVIIIVGAIKDVARKENHKDRVNDLVRWAECAGGCGLKRLEEVVDEVIPNNPPLPVVRSIIRFLKQAKEELIKFVSKRSVQIAVVVVVLATPVVYSAIRFLMADQPTRELMLINWRIWPEPVRDIVWTQPGEEFNFTSDGGSWENSNKWDYPSGEWRIVKGEGSSPLDGAMVVKGLTWGLPKIAPHAFYDFDARFKVQFSNTATAAWVFHAKNKQNGYVFTLKKSDNGYSIKGFVYERLGNLGELSLTEQPTPIKGCCREDDAIVIRAQVRGFQFSYFITVENDGPNDPRPILGREFPAGTLLDGDERYRFGNIGLLQIDNDSQMQVEFFRVTPVNK